MLLLKKDIQTKQRGKTTENQNSKIIAKISPDVNRQTLEDRIRIGELHMSAVIEKAISLLFALP